MPSPEEVRAAAERHVAAANAGDAQAIADNFAPDAVWYDPVGQPPHVGRDGIRAFFEQTQTLADKIEMKLLDVITAGNEAAMIMEIHATFGDATSVMDCVETIEVGDDGKVTTMKAYWDLTRARSRGE